MKRSLRVGHFIRNISGAVRWWNPLLVCIVRGGLYRMKGRMMIHLHWDNDLEFVQVNFN